MEVRGAYGKLRLLTLTIFDKLDRSFFKTSIKAVTLDSPGRLVLGAGTITNTKKDINYYKNFSNNINTNQKLYRK